MIKPIIVFDQSTKATGYCLEVNGVVKWGVIEPNDWSGKTSVFRMKQEVEKFYNEIKNNYGKPFMYLEKSTTHKSMTSTSILGGLFYGMLDIWGEVDYEFIKSSEFINNFLKVKVNEYSLKEIVYGDRRLKDGKFPNGLLSKECKIASVLIANKYIREFHPDKDILNKSEHDVADALCLYLYIKEKQ